MRSILDECVREEDMAGVRLGYGGRAIVTSNENGWARLGVGVFEGPQDYLRTS